VVLPETSPEQALVLAERIRASVESSEFDPGGGRPPEHITVSIGVTSLKAGLKDAEELVKMADKALYEAKDTGRNKVCVYGNL